MQAQEIMQAQIDSAMAGLARIRERLANAGATDAPDLIGHDLEWAASHLEDIRHVWRSLKSSAAARASVRPPRIVAAAPSAKMLAR
ncbi:MAG: hypothetical protein Q7V00_05200 [Sulfurimicrobium sp.]|nr:hypothetical protein [Sulfurimicrobium sp.]MDP1703979.1 hypothetical protein [Sulfurimicrobium sp.]MDP2200042.1 hypothetical protein [Sulfurimicrobium sp.]MDP3686100.1 hypothetical protein [Sulfurimicrobium sp.]MDZ7656160.1 hypothetical protein [Sulfurimicrobium sp.]